MNVQQLISRFVQLGCKEDLRVLLSQLKEAHNLGNAIKIKSDDEIARSLRVAIDAEHLTIEDLYALLDEKEENGGQHIYLFDLTDVGRRDIRARDLAERFGGIDDLSARIRYSPLPATHTWFEQRGPLLVVKRISTEEYAHPSFFHSRLIDGVEYRSPQPQKRRFVSLLIIDPVSGQAELRIERLGGHNSKHAQEMFLKIKNELFPTIDLIEHFKSVRVDYGFDGITSNRTETFMSHDAYTDGGFGGRFVRRRDEGGMIDIRDDPGWQSTLHRLTVCRKSLSVYWVTENALRLHSVLSTPEILMGINNRLEFGKVFIQEKMSPDQVSHVVNRVRHYCE